jgi:hypothetical protein
MVRTQNKFVILSVAVAIEVEGHGLKWGPMDHGPIVIRVVKFPEGTQENSAGWSEAESWDCIPK